MQYYGVFENMKISVLGAGYVGMSIAVLLSEKYDVIAFDIDQEKIKKINNKQSPIKDNEIKYLKAQILLSLQLQLIMMQEKTILILVRSRRVLRNVSN